MKVYSFAELGRFGRGKRNAVGYVILLLLLASLTGYSIYSEIEVRHFFWADDWAWLFGAEFKPYSEIFSWLPRHVYNDRPVGAIAVKIMYVAFGLRFKAYLYAQALIHVGNCGLLYIFAKRYIGDIAALMASGLAALWISANTAVFWTAAIFDLLGATLCLIAMIFWRMALTRGRGAPYAIASALAYYLAIRTKEFAIGVPAMLFAIGILLERKSFMECLKGLIPHALVLAPIGFIYGKLIFANALGHVGDNTYTLYFDAAIFTTAWFYLQNLFYFETVSVYFLIAAGALVLSAFVIARKIRPLLIVCLLGYLVCLGPVLLLKNQHDPLYLYTPHFFVALAIGALISINAYYMCLTCLYSAFQIVGPLDSRWLGSVHNYYDVKTLDNLQKFEAFSKMSDHFESGSTIVISGLEPYFNPFAFGAGSSIRIAKHDNSLRFLIEKPEAELSRGFCSAAAPKHFLHYDGNKLTDQTGSALTACDGRGIESPDK